MTPEPSLLKALDYSVLQQCMHCGLCLPSCPTYLETGRERNSPRGRISLMRAIADDELGATKAFAEEMSYCLGCLACTTACPAGVDYGTLFETGRAEAERSGAVSSAPRSLIRSFTLRFLLLRPWALRAAARLWRSYEVSGMRRLVRASGLFSLLPKRIGSLERQAFPVGREFSDALVAAVERPAGEIRHRVAVLTGCIQDVAFSEMCIRDSAELIHILGQPQVLTEREDLISYSFDATAVLRQLPRAVVFPRTTAEVAAVVRLARQHGAPIVARGSGTGLSGGSVPVSDSIVLCLVKMDRILELDSRNFTLRAQAGVLTQAIYDAADAAGLFYPPDPGSMKVSTLGGNVAENSGGLRGLKYGVTRDYVMGLEVVMADGEICLLGNKCVKDVAGYSLKDLFIGSEGTLGIVTEVLLKLLPKPAARQTLLATYARMEAAAETVSAIIAARIVPCTLCLLYTSRCV